MDWQDYQDEFILQGDLCQIIVTKVLPKDWQKILNFLEKTDVALSFFVDGVESALPAQIKHVFQQDKHHYFLSLVFDEVTLNCDFDRHEDIVLSFDPRQIINEARATLLFRIMSTFGRRLKKVVLLTAINSETQPIFRYAPGEGLTYIKLNKKLKPYD